MNLLLLGKNGQLGWELQRSLLPLGDLVCCDYPEVDFSDVEALHKFIRTCEPDLIINAAAYTDVDGAEAEEMIAQRINAEAPGILAERAAECGAAIIHYSTDYIFDGAKGIPYVETDAPNPINVYGRTKLEGEQAVQSSSEAFMIFRTSWVYGARRSNFMLKVLEWARENEILQIAEDQVGSPSWCRMLAEETAAVIAQSLGTGPSWFEDHAGVYHLAGRGAASRYEWAEEVVKLYPQRTDLAVRTIHPVPGDTFKTVARRPLNTALDCSRFEATFGLQIPEWRESLRLLLSGLDCC